MRTYDAVIRPSIVLFTWTVLGWLAVYWLSPPIQGAPDARHYPEAAESLRAGRWTEAAARAQASIRQAVRAHDNEALYQNYGYLGAAHQRRGHIQEALTAYQVALAGARQAGDVVRQAQYAYHIGNLSIGFTDTSQALTYLEEARRLSQQVGDARLEAWTLLRMNEAYDRLGDYEQAHEYARQALAIHQRISDPEGICYDYKSLGDFELLIGDYEQATDLYSRALGVTQERTLANKVALQAMILSNLGLIAFRRGEHDRAQTYYEQARQLVEQSQDASMLQTTLGQIGTIYLRQGDPERARSYLERARQLAVGMGLRASEGFWLSRLGEAHRQRGEIREAEAFYQRALTQGRQLQYNQLVEEATAGLGAVKEAQGDWPAALDLYSQAITLIEAERRRLVLEEEKAGYFMDKLEVYERLVRLLVRLHQRDPSRGYGRQAFEYAERAKAQGFLQKVPQAVILRYLKEKSAAYQQWDMTYQKERAQLYGQLLSARREWDRLQKDLIRSEPVSTERQSQIANLERELAEREKGHVQFMAHQVRDLFPQLAKLYEAEILSVDRVQTLLRATEVLIEYHVQEEKTFAFVVHKTRMDIVELEFGRNQSEGLRQVLAGARWAYTSQAKASRTGEALLAGLQRLYGNLFVPLEKDIPAESALIIIPDDMLSYLPFAMLITERSGSHVQYLIERYPMSYADSASLLNPALWTKFHRPIKADLDWLALANPDFQGPGGEKLGALPFAEKEVQAIGPYFKRTRVLTGRAATEAAFKAQAARARLIHLATHNLLDPTNVWRSRIVLTLRPEVNQNGYDGFIHLYEVFALDLDTELVVLSACDSGSGTVKTGEGLEGMTRAFLYAGARSVLGMLWWADDQTTSELMPKFYGYLAQGMDKRRALQAAQIDLIRAGWTHPHLWAGFRLSGEAGPMQTPMRRRTAPPYRAFMTSMIPIVILAITMTVRRMARKRQTR